MKFFEPEMSVAMLKAEMIMFTENDYGSQTGSDDDDV